MIRPVRKKLPRPLIGINFAQRRREADFRHSLVRLRDNSEAIAFYAQELIAEGRELPPPRTLDELGAAPEFADDLRNHTAVLVEWPPLPAAD